MAGIEHECALCHKPLNAEDYVTVLHIERPVMVNPGPDNDLTEPTVQRSVINIDICAECSPKVEDFITQNS